MNSCIESYITSVFCICGAFGQNQIWSVFEDKEGLKSEPTRINAEGGRGIRSASWVRMASSGTSSSHLDAGQVLIFRSLSLPHSPHTPLGRSPLPLPSPPACPLPRDCSEGSPSLLQHVVQVINNATKPEIEGEGHVNRNEEGLWSASGDCY